MQATIEDPLNSLTQSAVDVDEARWIEIERLKLVYTNLTTALPTSIGAACILALLLRNVVSVAELMAWFAIGVLITGVRCVHCFQFHQLDKLDGDASDLVRWRFRLELGAVLSGLFWAYASGVLFPRVDLVPQMFIAFTLAGLSAGAMTSHSAILRSYLLFVLPAVVPLVLWMAVKGTDGHRSMALLTILFLCVVVRSAIETRRVIATNLRVRSEHSQLTRALHYQATHDPLVDLANQRGFSTRLRQ